MGTLEGAWRAAARKLSLSPEFYEKQLRRGRLWCFGHQAFCPRNAFERDHSRPNGRRSSCLRGDALIAERRRDQQRERRAREASS